MRLLSSSLFLIFMLFSVKSYAQSFKGIECLKSDYTYDIINSNYLFGLANERLLIKKSACVINIEYKKLLKTSWEIDVCREPIHMKVVEYGRQTIYKRFTKCQKNDQTDYCVQLQKLNSEVLDFGLMYAEGSREVLTSKHGRTYCLASLARKYLAEGFVFSTTDNKINLFTEEATPLPEVAPQVSPAPVEVVKKNETEEVEKTSLSTNKNEEALDEQMAEPAENEVRF